MYSKSYAKYYNYNLCCFNCIICYIFPFHARNPTYFHDVYTDPTFKNTIQKTCMSSGGIPIQPYWTLGGFIPENVTGFPEQPIYEDSTAVSMNIIVNNFDPHSEDPVDVQGLVKAKAWEKVYIEFMKEWVSNEENMKYMDIAFTSERSIEDELDRETYMDIAIIALSYILMFVYITFSLGRITTMNRFLVSFKNIYL